MIIICCSSLCIACSTQEDDNATNLGTANLTDVSENILVQTDDNAGQNAQEENQLANTSENTTDTDSNALEKTDNREDQDIEENQLTQISDKTDEKAEPYIDTYVSLTDDTEIEYCEWMKYGEEQVLRVAIQYKEQPENDYRHKEDYFLFITQNGDVSKIIEVNYEDKGVPSGIETDCATQHQLGWACDFNAHFEDVTFDGKEDLLIFVGYSKSSAFYCAYIYENGEFRYERTFEHIDSYVVDTEKEVLYGSAAYGALDFADMTYKYINGEFLITEFIETIYVQINGETFESEKMIYEYEYEFINGKNVLAEIIETIYKYEYINGANVLIEETVNKVDPEQPGRKTIDLKGRYGKEWRRG